MKIKLGIILFIGLMSSALAYAQTGVDFKPKALVKALQKAGLEDTSVIEEIKPEKDLYSAEGINGKYFLIKEDIENNYRYIYVGRVNSCRAGGCSIPGEMANSAESEYFDYYILFNENKTVEAVKVFNYQATHGQEITARGWLKQFLGYDGSEPLVVDKNIDTISGATISVYAITVDVEMKTEILKKISI